MQLALNIVQTLALIIMLGVLFMLLSGNADQYKIKLPFILRFMRKRRVVFRQLIPDDDRPGKFKWSTDFTGSGKFHCWGHESQDWGEGMVMDTVAIIEDDNGNMKIIPPELIRFI